MKYPDIITPNILQENSHLPDSEVEADIKDTEMEIEKMTMEMNGYRLIAEADRGMAEGKMAAFRQSAREQGISERREFVAFLRRLLEARA